MYPWENLTAMRKWEWLRAKGYYENVEFLDQRGPHEGIEFIHEYRAEKGFIDWWGKVTWYE